MEKLLTKDEKYRRLILQQLIGAIYINANSIFVRTKTVENAERIDIDALIKMIHSLTDLNEERLINLSQTREYIYDPRDIDDLKKSDKFDSNKLLDLERDLKNTAKFVSFNESLPSMLMKLSTVRRSFDETSWHHFEEEIENLLASLSYDRESQERVYLSQNLPTLSWYRAYLIENPTVPLEEHSFLLDELLNGFFKKKGVLTKYITKAAKDHLSKEGCTISRKTVTSLIESRTIKADIAQELFANAIAEMNDKTPQEIITTRFATLPDLVQFSDIKAIFDELFFVAPLNMWLIDFVNALFTLDDKDELADALLEYLKMCYGAKRAALFEDAYILNQTELHENRQKLLTVLKAIEKKL